MGAVPTTHITVHIDAVLICTPLNLHAPMVIDALRAGKHVFIEKCLIFKEEEGERIRKVAEGHPQQVLQVGIQRRSSALYKVAMQMARKGAIGKVLLVRAQWHMNNDWRRPVSDAKYERLINPTSALEGEFLRILWTKARAFNIGFLKGQNSDEWT